MTPKQKIYKNALLRALHTSPRYLNLYKEDDELYREFLKDNFGVKSSKDLSIESLENLVAYFEFKVELKKATKGFKISSNQVEYLWELWCDRSLHKDMPSLLAFIKRLTKKEIKEIEELSKKEATIMINAVRNLKKILPANNSNYKGA